MKVKSVCGELSRDQLGTVTPHEHVLLDLTGFYQALPVPGIEDPATQKVEMWNLGILSRDCYALRDNLLLMDEEVQAEELAVENSKKAAKAMKKQEKLNKKAEEKAAKKAKKNKT